MNKMLSIRKMRFKDVFRQVLYVFLQGFRGTTVNRIQRTLFKNLYE